MKLFILISTLIVIAQAQFGGGRFGPGARAFGPGGVGGFGPGAGGFGPGFGGRFVGGGVGRFGGGGFAGRGIFAPAVAVAPVIAAPVIAMPVARVVPIGGFGLGGFGPRAVVVARPHLLVGRSVAEDFRFSYLPKLKQIELFFGGQRIACDVELRNLENVHRGVYTTTAIEPTIVDFELVDVAAKKMWPLSIYWENSINKRGFFVKSKICYNAIFDTIKNEFKKADFGLIVA